jgi:hypothetical protein
MNRFINAGAVLSTTPNNLYTCPNNSHAVIHTLFFSRTDLDPEKKIYINVQVLDASMNAIYNLAFSTEVLTHSTLSFDKPINLDSNDVLIVSATSDDNDVHVFASILHIVPMSL